MDILVGILGPLMMALSFIIFVISGVYLILMMICIVKEVINNNYICDETKEDEDNEDIDIIQRAIIIIGGEKIEVEVDYYKIDDMTVEIESKDGKVYIIGIKNVLLMSE